MNDAIQWAAWALSAHRYRFSSEVVLHEGMALALQEAGIKFEREFVAGPADRFDFLLPGGLVIEAKIKGTLAQALAQCMRYAERDDVHGVLLAVSRYWGVIAVPPTLNGKPFVMVKLQAKVF